MITKDQIKTELFDRVSMFDNGIEFDENGSGWLHIWNDGEVTYSEYTAGYLTKEQFDEIIRVRKLLMECKE